MAKKFKVILILTVIGCFLLGNTTVFASEPLFQIIPEEKSVVIKGNGINNLATPMLTECIAGVGIASNGLSISFDTTATQSAKEIGVRNVVLQEKTWYGGWNDISMGSYYTNNSDWYSVSFVYTAAEEGKTYRVKCTHYAKYDTTEIAMENTSSEITYN